MRWHFRPLMHLIRNAIDHAIEPAEQRARRGKPAAGRVRLSAAQKGNHVQLVVEDDGAGIDEDRVREVAIQRGLASARDVREMSRREVMNLIFVPGFSTARQVTSLSGRGVGMDVVKNNIANLSGIIELQTERGRGTRFEITLPVTLAIVRALVVAVAVMNAPVTAVFGKLAVKLEQEAAQTEFPPLHSLNSYWRIDARETWTQVEQRRRRIRR